MTSNIKKLNIYSCQWELEESVVSNMLMRET